MAAVVVDSRRSAVACGDWSKSSRMPGCEGQWMVSWLFKEAEAEALQWLEKIEQEIDALRQDVSSGEANFFSTTEYWGFYP